MPIINFRVPSEVYDQIQKTAGASNQTVSEFARAALASAVSKSDGRSTDPKDVAHYIALRASHMHCGDEDMILDWITKGVLVK